MNFDIRDLLNKAYDLQASDLHITVDSPPVFRIHGELKPYGDLPLTAKDTETLAKEIIEEKLWPTFLEKGEMDFNYELEGISRFRVNAFRQKGNISIAFRLIPVNIPTIEDLKLPTTLKKLMVKPQGLILVTGPTGSGKSTTLAAMIDYVNQNFSKHIITLEDPIEFVHTHQKSIINQREVGFDTNSFASGLRAALRQDPDIILVGEMRDLETISTAVTAAETGHLVFSTLHTNDATQAVDRMIDVFPPHQQQQMRIQLASVLQGVIAQQLLPRRDRKGRVAAFEILIANPAVRNLIREGKTHQIANVMQTSAKVGMQSMEKAIQDLVRTGKVAPDVAQERIQSMGY